MEAQAIDYVRELAWPIVTLFGIIVAGLLFELACDTLVKITKRYD